MRIRKKGNFLVWKISGFFCVMTGTKHRTVRRKKRRPPVNRYFRSEPAATALSSPPGPSIPGFSTPDPSTTSGPSTPGPSATPCFSSFSATSDPSTSAPSATPCRLTASDRKLSKSPYFPVEVCEDKYERLDLDKFVGYMESLSGVGLRVIELQGLCRAIQLRSVCSECDGGLIEVREDMHRREGLIIHPYLYCTNCGGKIILVLAHHQVQRQYI